MVLGRRSPADWPKALALHKFRRCALVLVYACRFPKTACAPLGDVPVSVFLDRLKSYR
ncbi:hypothetical protein MPL3356_240064 [Mesorhizobium plurifarium]|uniref:Uncharacterized protein n=1 Tax=Mesorhizobium plurifarium TaxID=69974 RepID=A0A090DTD4_MESPL|nr:hypothetical protein MPL3356_240064 [Mesorhizobium plurifarium]